MRIPNARYHAAGPTGAAFSFEGAIPPAVGFKLALLRFPSGWRFLPHGGMGARLATADTEVEKGKGRFPRDEGASMMDVKLRGWHDRDQTDDSYALDLTDHLEVILTLKDLNAGASNYALR